MSGSRLRKSDSPSGLKPPQTLVDRFTDQDLLLLGDVGSLELADVAWELLYYKEPELYEKLVAAEALHPGIVEWLPSRVGSAVEIGAGTGRLTVSLSQRCESLTAIEPSPAARNLLAEKLQRESIDNVTVLDGRFDAVPVEDDSADLVVACSSFTSHPSHGGDAGLAEMRRVASEEALIAIVCPTDIEWLAERGFQHIEFEGERFAEYETVEDALEIARIFYPWAVETIEQQQLTRVSYEVLQIKAPNELCWTRT